jgi:hypothetical protein
MTDEEFAQQVFAVPIDGIPAGTMLVALRTYVNELHQVHALKTGSAMTITETLRQTGAIQQSISEADGTVTTERV